MNLCAPIASPPPTAEAYLRQRTAALLPGGPALQNIVELAAGVWQINLAEGGKLVAKYQAHGWLAAGTAHDLLAVERQVLDLLLAAACPVPRILAIDPETQFIFFEYRGDHTLDDMCQENATGLQTLARHIISGFCQIERTLTAHIEVLDSLIHPAATLKHLRTTIDHIGAQAHSGLDYLLNSSAASAPRADLHDLLDRIVQHSGATAPTLGSTDYNARNIVVDRASRRPSFIEFAKLGWDWPERRLVQYLTSLGGGHPNGRFHSLVNPNSAKWYARCAGGDADDRILALDSHHILFHLNAAALLSKALETPQQPPHARLLQRWRQPQRRMQQLARALSQNLSPAAPTAHFRNLLSHTINSGEKQL